MDRRKTYVALRIASCCALVALADVANAKSQMIRTEKAACRAALRVDANGSEPLRAATLPPQAQCVPVIKRGFPTPDPNCTPGAINPTLTLQVLTSRAFKTGCVRDQATSAEQKRKTYHWYRIRRPANNTGKNQICELDHFISLEIGGADTIENIWPQCGPSRRVALSKRYFKQKDIVENYLAWLVKNRRMFLDEAQRGIADDWTQYRDDATAACPGGQCRDENLPPLRTFFGIPLSSR
jgi:hypothetical protein